MLKITDMPVVVEVGQYAPLWKKHAAVLIMYGQYFLYYFIAAIVIHLGWSLI